MLGHISGKEGKRWDCHKSIGGHVRAYSWEGRVRDGNAIRHRRHDRA